MHRSIFTTFGTLAACGLSACALAADVPRCSAAQGNGYAPEPEEVAAHRLFPEPVFRYPFGTQLTQPWGTRLSLAVDRAGRIVCYGVTGVFEHDKKLDGPRRTLLDAMKTWRYQPFFRDGKATAAVVSEHVVEEELPQAHRPLPSVPLDQVRITLERSGCLGTCPSYKVELQGDGRVTYTGGGSVDVEGRHTYRVPPAEVARLVQSLREKDLWSLRAAYVASITDNPSFELTIAMGGQTHRIEDYVGGWAGMPRSVGLFEDEVDKATGSLAWIHLSTAAIDRLQAEGFAFASPEGASLLARAVLDDDTHDDRALLRLIELGAPIDGAKPHDDGRIGATGSLLEEALKRHRSLLIEPLIAKGVLRSGGKPDQAKIDAAFRSAIAGGRLSDVQRIWNEAGTRPHPSLSFHDDAGDSSYAEKLAPVTLLLRPGPPGKDDAWEGRQIAAWLLSRGCDLRASGADGRTLLHIAAAAGAPAFVRDLIARGMDPSTPGQFGLPAIGSTDSEEVAMTLLEAGSNLRNMDSDGKTFRQQAEESHWTRVVAWLDAHRM